MESALNLPELLKTYLGDEKVLSIVKLLGEKKSLYLSGLSGSSLSFVLQSTAENKPGIHLVVAQGRDEAAYLLSDLEVFPSQKAEALFFPSSFKKSFSTEEINTPYIQLRAAALNSIRSKQSLIIISYPEAIAEKVISNEGLEKNSITIKVGEKLSLSFLTDIFNEYGFERSDYVIEPGQFSIRGGIVDVFSFASDVPFRIEFSGDEIESIRSFNIENQLSTDTFENAAILPNVQEKIKEEKSSSLIDFILENKKDCFAWVSNTGHIFSTIETGMKSILEKEASDFFIHTEILKNSFSTIPLISTNSKNSSGEKVEFNFSPQPYFNKNFNLLFENLQKHKGDGYSNIILFDGKKQIDRLKEIYESIFAENKKEHLLPFGEDLGGIHEGFIDNTNKIICYTDHQIFGRYHRYKLKSNSFKKYEAITLKMLKSLQPGDFITHIDYGIGRFGGLEKISVNGKEQETIRLVYKDNDTLYISIHSLHQISKYSGKDSEAPRLDKLGSNAWSSLKNRTKKKIKELAFDLVKLYAERKSKKGFAFAPDNYLQNELEASFIYEDTPDQLKATIDVKRDMEQEYPMDRLVCGDVGFGKTEIAIRAAFKAAVNGKQTAVLVPTTILALQHYRTFSERMKMLPVKVDYINRFKSAKEQKETIEKLSRGKTDIIIGTHRLLGKDVQFKDLGLMIIDEEQKFGVGAKDKLKLIKANVDTLTLTATPIPRTLQFSMMGARDLSIINTAPPNRYPIQTEVHNFNEKIIEDAINHELQRGGQVFFIHNRVQTLARFAEIIQHLCPKAKVLTAHGQLTGETLEKAMMSFIEGEYDVLVCTTIVESGLDIANANTIIINDAQNYGLSDLHQLRGRVGRSNKKAFCYLLTPPFSTLTNEARKRLNALEEFSELGSGFNIAMRDLDIRGAGNLLGAEQSGFITEIGYEMYQKILDEAMYELKEEVANRDETEDQPKIQIPTTNTSSGFTRDCQIETDLSVLIPEDYVESISERIGLYQQLDNSKKEEDLIAFEKQMLDRFGKLPEQTNQLIHTVRLRWLAIKLGFEKLILKNGKLTLWFISNQKSPYYQSDVFTRILQFAQSNPKICTLNQGENKLSLKIENVKDIQIAMAILQKI